MTIGTHTGPVSDTSAGVTLVPPDGALEESTSRPFVALS
jgi:hypothetical protein